MGGGGWGHSRTGLCVVRWDTGVWSGGTVVHGHVVLW